MVAMLPGVSVGEHDEVVSMDDFAAYIGAMRAEELGEVSRREPHEPFTDEVAVGIENLHRSTSLELATDTRDADREQRRLPFDQRLS